jgi:pimeloyl-ACP methyl ester carboxylesterase
MRTIYAVARRILPAAACLAAGILIGAEGERLSTLFRCRVREVSFSGPGRRALVGRVYRPRGLPGRRYPAILFIHGLLPKGKDTPLYVHLLRRLARKGYLVFAFDLGGFGESVKAANYRIPHDCDFTGEAEAALSYMLRHLPVDGERLAVAGHSIGANLAVAVGSRDERVGRIIAISPGNFKEPSGTEWEGTTPLQRRFQRTVRRTVPRREWERIKEPLNIFRYLPLRRSAQVLLILAEDDAANIVEYGAEFHDRLDVPKRFVVIPDVNHNFGFDISSAEEMLDPAGVIRLARAIHKWMEAPAGDRRPGEGSKTPHALDRGAR